MFRHVIFYERQFVSRKAFALILGIGFVGLMMVFPEVTGSITPAQGVAGMILLAVSVFLLNLFTMTTWVYEEEVKVQLGRIIPYQTSRIPAQTIREVSTWAAPLDPEATGWGIKARSEGEETRTFHNVREGGVVALRADMGVYLIGTQYPEQLRDAVLEMLVKRGELEDR